MRLKNDNNIPLKNYFFGMNGSMNGWMNGITPHEKMALPKKTTPPKKRQGLKI